MEFKSSVFTNYKLIGYDASSWPHIREYLIEIYHDYRKGHPVNKYDHYIACYIFAYHEYPIYMNNPLSYSVNDLLLLKQVLTFIISHSNIAINDYYEEFMNMLLDVHEQDGTLKIALTHAQVFKNELQIPKIMARINIKEWYQQVLETDQNFYTLDIKSMQEMVKRLINLEKENEELRLIPGGPEYQKALARFDEMSKS